MKSLSGTDRQSLQQFAGKPTLMMFFEPRCPWCFRQVRALNELLASCPEHFQPVAVGVNGSRKDLLKEVRKLRPDFPAFQISADLNAQLGEIAATPFTLLVDEQGQPVGWLRGYIAGERFLFASRPEALARALEVIYRPLATHLAQKAGYRCKEVATGAVTLGIS